MRKLEVSLDKYVELIILWAKEKGILDKGNPMSQGLKTLEEVHEMLTAIKDENLEELKDAVGDVFVTIVIQAELNGVKFKSCVKQAYDVISKRKGSMVNGQFVKE